MMGRKGRGHYCYVCGRVRANEKFSGKGHRNHICRDCQREMKKGVEPHPFGAPVPPTPHEPQTRLLRERVAEDLLLMLLYLSASRNEELDSPRCDRSVLDRLIDRLEKAELITSHKRCLIFTDIGREEAANLLTEFGLDRWEDDPY